MVRHGCRTDQQVRDPRIWVAAAFGSLAFFLLSAGSAYAVSGVEAGISQVETGIPQVEASEPLDQPPSLPEPSPPCGSSPLPGPPPSPPCGSSPLPEPPPSPPAPEPAPAGPSPTAGQSPPGNGSAPDGEPSADPQPASGGQQSPTEEHAPAPPTGEETHPAADAPNRAPEPDSSVPPASAAPLQGSVPPPGPAAATGELQPGRVDAAPDTSASKAGARRLGDARPSGEVLRWVALALDWDLKDGRRSQEEGRAVRADLPVAPGMPKPAARQPAAATSPRNDVAQHAEPVRQRGLGAQLPIGPFTAGQWQGADGLTPGPSSALRAVLVGMLGVVASRSVWRLRVPLARPSSHVYSLRLERPD
jgi:hypothetical protein